MDNSRLWIKCGDGLLTRHLVPVNGGVVDAHRYQLLCQTNHVVLNSNMQQTMSRLRLLHME